MSFKEKIKEAVEFYSVMQERYPEVKWEVEHFMLDLTEEVGELSNAILCERGHKFKTRQKSTVEDALFDVLFDLFMIAEKMNIDLDEAWSKGLKDMQKRLDSGEFDP